MLAKAAYHIEMYNFYNDACFLVDCSTDEGTRAFLAALDYLNLADMMTYLIDNEFVNWSGVNDYKTTVNCLLDEYKEYYINEFKKGGGKLRKKVSDHELYENLDEILSSYENRDLANSIVESIFQMIKSLEKAEKFWGIN